MKKILFTIFTVLFLFINNTNANTIGIVAVVNDDIITSYDFYNRINMTMTNMGMPRTQENVQKISSGVLQELVFETLKIQSGKKLGFSVSSDEINNAISSVASKNNLTLEDLTEQLAKDNIDISTLEYQIKSSILWNKYISKKIAPTIIISEEEINDEFQRLKSDNKKPQYQIEQITIPKKEEYSYELIRSLLSESREKNEEFGEIAKGISPNYKAWVLLDNIPTELAEAIDKLAINEISDVIETDQFFSVVKLISTKQAGEEPNEDIKTRIRQSLAMQQVEIYAKRELKDIRDVSFIEIKMAR